ncbi:MAG: hypothetical protein PHF87_10585 [Desulfotomaculaceae bacterium]|nr:hypothetical protein [Desulfotomaculaceae bacterium]
MTGRSLRLNCREHADIINGVEETLKYYDYAGVIHIHSTNSDGQKDLPDIIEAAHEAGCDYMILTDHDILEALPAEGWYGNTIVLAGEEISVGEGRGHYLAMRLASAVQPHSSPQETINNVRARDGIGFIAHPFYDTTKRWIFGLTPVTWKDWNITGFNGLEIWNYSADWRENFTGLITYPVGLLCPNCFIDGPPAAVLKKWDELLRFRKVTGIGSVDAHGHFYSYMRMFKTLRTHVVLEEALSFQAPFFSKDKNMIYMALEKGNCYFSYDYLANAGGFMYSADNGRRQVIMGDEINITGAGVTLKISSPQPGLLRIIKDSRLVASAAGARTLVEKVTEPGAYRAELLIKNKPWIYSNPIYVSGKSSFAARA